MNEQTQNIPEKMNRPKKYQKKWTNPKNGPFGVDISSGFLPTVHTDRQTNTLAVFKVKGFPKVKSRSSDAS